MESRIREMHKRWEEVRSSPELSSVREAVGQRVAVLEAGRNLMNTWIHGRGLSLAHNRPRVYASSQLL